MSTKLSAGQESAIKWPKTPQRLAADFQRHQEAVAAVAAVGQMVTAASAVPMPRSKKLLSDAAQEAMKGNIGSNQKGAAKERSWKKHANQYFADNRAWDEVNDIYVQCTDLMRTSIALTPLLKQKPLLRKVKNVGLLTRNIMAIVRDTQALSSLMIKIHEQHKDKTGGTKNQEEMMKSCAVFSQYVDFMERYDSALMPLIVHASEQLQEALVTLHKEDPALALELHNNLNQTLNSIRNIVHDTTGADPVETPAAEQPATTETPAEVAA